MILLELHYLDKVNAIKTKSCAYQLHFHMVQQKSVNNKNQRLTEVYFKV